MQIEEEKEEEAVLLRLTWEVRRRVLKTSRTRFVSDKDNSDRLCYCLVFDPIISDLPFVRWSTMYVTTVSYVGRLN